MNIGSLYIQLPWLLLLATAPWLWQRVHKFDSVQHRLRTMVDAHLLPRILLGKPGELQRTWFVVAWIMTCVAASGPYLSTNHDNATQPALDLAIVVDISPSMAGADAAPSRLQQAKWQLDELLRRLEQSRVALVAFSANAYVMLPLTHDLELAHHYVDMLSTDLPARKDSNLALALERAAVTLRESRKDSRAIIVFSDGETDRARSQAKANELAAQNIPVYTLGFGTTTGAPIQASRGAFLQDSDGPLISKLDISVLQDLSQTTRGQFISATPDDNVITSLLQSLSSLGRHNPIVIDSDTGQPLFPFLIALSLLVFMWRGRPQSLATVLVTCVLLGAQPSANAAPWNEQRGIEALQRGDLDSAAATYQQLNNYNGAIGRGIIAYRQQQFESAYAEFSSALTLARTPEERARALFNSGNALAQTQQWEKAEHAYREALRAQSNYPRAALNLSLVVEERRAQQTKGDHTPEQGEVNLLHSDNGSQPSRTTAGAQTTQVAAGASQRIEQFTGNLRGVMADNTHEFLQRRFAQQDRQQGLPKLEERP